MVKVRAFLPQHCRPAQPGQQSFDETFDEVYGRHFQPPRPARAALQQGLFQEDLLVEIEAIAVANQPKRLIVSEALPPLRRPYAQGGILVGHLLFLRGFTSQDQYGDLVGRGDMRAQTEQTFANMVMTLQAAGGSLADLVQTQVTLTDWHAYQEYHAIYTRHVQAPFPTNATLQGGLGREGLLIEIESIAALATPRLTIDSAFSQVGTASRQHQPDVIHSDRLAPRLAHVHGVRVGDLMFVSGHASIDAQGGEEIHTAFWRRPPQRLPPPATPCRAAAPAVCCQRRGARLAARPVSAAPAGGRGGAPGGGGWPWLSSSGTPGSAAPDGPEAAPCAGGAWPAGALVRVGGRHCASRGKAPVSR